MNQATREGLAYLLEKMEAEYFKVLTLHEQTQKELARYAGEVANLERRISEIKADLAAA